MGSYSENYRQIVWGDHSGWRRERRKEQGPSGPFYVMPDITPFLSPIDRREITSRSQLREHNKRHGVVQCGELNKPSDYDNSQRRAEAFNEKRLESAYRTALEKTGLL